MSIDAVAVAIAQARERAARLRRSAIRLLKAADYAETPPSAHLRENHAAVLLGMLKETERER